MKEITRIFDLLDLYRDDFSWKKDVFLKLVDGKWINYSSSDYLYFVDTLSLGFLSMGIQKGDKVATIILNSPEWNFIDMALMQIGAVHIPIFPTISESNYRFIFKDAGVRQVIVSNKDIYQNVASIIGDIDVEAVFSLDPIDGVNSWTDILARGKEHKEPGVLEGIKAEIGPDDIATMIYTSGTTANPKGVMLSHRNTIVNFLAACTIPDYKPEMRVLSFLPLCHSFGRILNYTFQHFGMSIYYMETFDNIGEMIRDVKPHTFGAVPRVLEKTYDKIVNKGRDLKGVKRMLFFWALNLGHRYELYGANGWWYEFQLKIANKLIFKKWREALGDHIYIIISGGAPLQARLARVFTAAKIQVLEGYGLTETSPVIAVSNLEPDGVMFGTVGPILPGIEVKIADDGEILTKSPCVMLGYYNNPEATKEVIDEEGWFHTGDIGLMEEGKYLRITDRKKEIFKTSGGKYIAPQVVENKFKESPFIDNVMVIGEFRNFCSAIIIPSFEHLESWCKVKGIEYPGRENAIADEVIYNRIKREVDEKNLSLDKVEQVKKFVLLPAEWDVKSEELSPTLKLKRKYLMDRYADLIESIYA